MLSKRIAWLFFVLLVNSFLLAQTNSSLKSIQKLVDEYLAPFQKYDLFSGTILIVKNGKTLVNKGYGYANYQHKVKNSPSTKFRMASLSKMFTHLAILQLAEKGGLHLNDKIEKYLPDFPNGDKITIQHLIDHSSGIPHLNNFPQYDQIAKEHYTVEEVITLFKDKPLDFNPGEKKTYSNSGYVLLVFIIEKVSGSSYAKYLEENIFQPAGMKNSGHDSGTQLIENMADGYMMNLEGKGLQKPLYYDPSIKIGGGSLYSTTEDLFLFSKAYQEGKLSKTTKPLYNQGTFGKSPGYNSLIWQYEGIFIALLSNNYSTPIRQVAWELSNMMLDKEYKIIDIKEDLFIMPEELAQYEGHYKIEDDIETIEMVNNVLIEYENGDKWRGCRLIPLGQDNFYDTCYLEKLTFTREKESGKIIGFEWESGDKAIRIEKTIKND